MTGINIDLSEVSRSIGNDAEYLKMYDRITEDTVIPFLVQCGLAPADDENGNTEQWTDEAQTILTYLVMMDERIEKTLFAALHDHIQALDGVRQNTTGERMYLVCKGCGEAFDNMQSAHEHGTFIPGPDPSWCGEDGFDMVPESEAL